MGNLSIKKTDQRLRLWRQLQEETGEGTVAGAIDVAARHYLRDLELKQQHVEEMPDDLVDALSTPFLPLQRDVQHTVGPEE